jgi:hypothetical protein
MHTMVLSINLGKCYDNTLKQAMNVPSYFAINLSAWFAISDIVAFKSSTAVQSHTDVWLQA